MSLFGKRNGFRGHTLRACWSRRAAVTLARKNGWAPMMGGLQAVYAREIKLWRRFLEIDEVVAALGRAVAPRPPTQEELIFKTSHQGVRTLAKAAD